LSNYQNLLNLAVAKSYITEKKKKLWRMGVIPSTWINIDK
jgi:orotate phosphoribosyltransferase